MSKDLTGRLRRLGEDLSERLAAGQSLEDAIGELGSGFPPMYRAVVTAGVRSGRLTSALEDIAATARRVQKMRISYLTASVYPAILLILAGIFGMTVGMEQLRMMREVCNDSFVPETSFIVRSIDFFAALKPLFMALIPLGGLMLFSITLLQVWPSFLFLGDGFVTWLLPGAKKAARNCQWAMVFDLMGLLIRHRCPLPEAVRLATAATCNRRLTASGRQWAERIEMGDLKSAPPELNPLSRWLLASQLEPDALADSLALTSERYYAQARRQSLWIQNQLPIYATLVIGGIVVVLYALMLFVPWIGILRYVLVLPAQPRCCRVSFMQSPFSSSNPDSDVEHPLPGSAASVEDSKGEQPAKPTTISLNAAESAELLRSIGELSAAGMPLDAGLEALAEEVSQRKLKLAFRQLAKEIRAGGNPLVDHDLSFVRLPKYHQSVLVAGIQSNRLGETLYELLEEENWRSEYWRDLWAALSYPLLLAAVTLLIVDLLNVFIMPMIQTQFLDIYEDFALDLSFDPEIFRAPTISWTSFFLLGGVGLFLIPAFLSPAQTALLKRSVPVVGKIFWWYESLDLIIKLRLVVAQNVPIPTALRLLVDAVSSRRFAELLPVWAEQMERGKKLGEVWQVAPDIPPSILPLVRWGESNNSLAEALESAERLLKERLALRRELIRKIGPPVITILVLAALFWAAVRLVVLVSPLIDLIQALS